VNIIDFTEALKKRQQEKEELELSEAEAIEYDITDLALSIAGEITDAANDLGYPIGPDNDKFAYDILLLVESIKSLLYRALGKEYPMQTITEMMFELSDPKALLNDFFEIESEE